MQQREGGRAVPCDWSCISFGESPVSTARARAGAGAFESVTRINVKEQQRTWIAPPGTEGGKKMMHPCTPAAVQFTLQAESFHIRSGACCQKQLARRV